LILLHLLTGPPPKFRHLHQRFSRRAASQAETCLLLLSCRVISRRRSRSLRRTCLHARWRKLDITNAWLRGDWDWDITSFAMPYGNTICFHLVPRSKTYLEFLRRNLVCAGIVVGESKEFLCSARISLGI